MAPNLSNFERAEYTSTPIPETALAPEPIEATFAPDAPLLARGVLCGVAGAFAGAVIYAVFIGVTHINIGYLAVLVAYLVAKAITYGSRGRGGRNFQIAALLLTYLAVSAANAGLIWWEYHKQVALSLNPHTVLTLAKLGIELPFLRLQTSPGGALLDLFILFIGLRAAWRMTSGNPGAVRHPFAR